MSGVAPIVERCLALHEDLGLGAARRWKEAEAGRKVIGFLPTYVPRELIHAAGMLPFGIIGGGDKLEIIKGDAYFQSYICHIPRSVIELGVSDRLSFLDGAIFPSICDVIRNLSGMWKLLFPDVYVRYFDVPQNYDAQIGGQFYYRELVEFRADLARIGGRPVTDDALRASIEVWNENRALVNALYDLRADQPWKIPASEAWLLSRAGLALPVEEHNELLRAYLRLVPEEDRPEKDNSRVVVRGAFCEQPPLDLIRTLERAGCYIVDDDFLLVQRWFGREIETAGDPLWNLALAFIRDSVPTAARYEPDGARKGLDLIECARARSADGVIFAAPSFCDPALLERPLILKRLEQAGIPSTSFKYSENTGQFQPIKEQAGTFSDSIKLWSGT